ncbi:MAG: exodeoxyribonuclease V subunit gamma [Burkholderiaceae bacterium]|nr:exodeoxyribonuclease V subunit gamma [Burkholderiaceae bacterium]MCD8564928.1 exodeoxyribonuclease V subunit gamma [Burkholderiaceae bacterium]
MNNFDLSRMNPAQQQAVRYLDGPSLVLAGAGSGKTRVITSKISYLVGQCGYEPKSVFAVTFTNKAAAEMRERLFKMLGADRVAELNISTFHSLGVRLLREESKAAGLKTGFSIMDAQDCFGLIQSLVATTDKARLKAVQQQISLWKNALLDPDAAAREVQNATAMDAARVYRSYQASLRAYQAVDFDDLIMVPCEMLAENSQIREKWQNRIRYLLIDEYQDTNACQYELVRHLTGVRAMFTAVGDDDQAIYGWRGATMQNLARLQEDYPALKLIKLEQNYRSTQTILAAANNLIARNPKLFPKQLWSELGTGEAISVSRMEGELEQAQAIAIRLSAARTEKRASWRDFAVLYRSNQQARAIEQAMRDLRIPYTVSGGQSFFDKAEVRDILAYLRLLANDNDDPAFIRAATTPRRGIGQATLQTLGEYAAKRHVSMFVAACEQGAQSLINPKQLLALQAFVGFLQRFAMRASQPASREPVAALLDELMAAINYEHYLYDVSTDDRAARARWQTVLELLDWLKTRATESNWNLSELVQHVALVTMLERQGEQSADAVTLSTLHAAKGLEFPHVYLVGIEEGLLPHLGRESDEDSLAGSPERIEEERRLMYVGITRAQRSLHLTWCARRRRSGQDQACEISRFVAEMGLEQQPAIADPGASLTPKGRLDMLKAMLTKPGAL